MFGAAGWLGPQDSRQYLFCLRPRPELRAASAKQLKGVTNMGKLDITWRSNLGERGRLQTSQLQRMVRTRDVGGDTAWGRMTGRCVSQGCANVRCLCEGARSCVPVMLEL